ncbi:MAG TPA: ABC transporter permease [Candidatus Limnocylindria bacterium]|jgi:NitT/TauT family transport system permease protein|nr:ABC transporter permease [Candidatus Limnocylindria bacterium]
MRRSSDPAVGDLELAGLDALELPITPRQSLPWRMWRATWPQLAAAAVVIAVWQLVVMSGVKPTYVLPGPLTVGERLVQDLADSRLLMAIGTTMRRIALGFGLALLIGSLIGIAVVRWQVLRTAIGSLITGLQTMPSIAWFPLAILLFKPTEEAILFVAVLGATPSVANGLITGVDHVPRVLLRAGRVLGARGIDAYRYVILPAALPSFIGGMKQAWAFAWRSLLAGELLVIIAQQPALGVRLQLSREFADAAGLLSTMIVILVIGIVIDAIFFGRLDTAIRRRWGLLEGRE